jgi:hypothetical protein
MGESPRAARKALVEVRRLRLGTRADRRGAWLVLVLFGIATLVALPLYRIRISCLPSLPCTSQAGSAAAVTGIYVFITSGVLRLCYWSVAFVIVFSITFAYYRRLNAMTGVRGKTRPMIRIGLLLSALVLVAGGLIVPLGIRLGAFGTAPLLIIALSLAVLAVYERSAGMVALVGGYWILAACSLFYNDANELRRVHLGGPFTGSWSLLPNLVVPGTYLILAGLLLLSSRRRFLRPVRQSGVSHD